MKHLRRLSAFALALILCFSFWVRAEEPPGGTAVLTLPGGVTVIDEQAFMDSGAFDRVALPDGIEWILSKAFAGSSLSAINLPDTITFIAEDAFDGSQLTFVAARKGTYGHDWAVEHGFLQPLTLSIALTAPEGGEGEPDGGEPGEGAAAQEFQTGDTASWTAAADGGLAPYHYTFALYRDGEPVAPDGEQPEPDAFDVFSYTFVEPGEYYVIATAADENGDGAEARSETLNVTLSLPSIVSFSSADSAFETIQAYTWNTTVSGGAAPYEYRYELRRGGTALYVRDYSEKSTLYYTFFESGSYSLSVTVRDAAGATSETLTQDFQVAASNATISGVVRIYVDVDASGKVIYNNNSKTGHYELQINNSKNNQLAYDDHLYTNPAFSFQSGAGMAGVVAVSDGDQILRPYSALYTFSYQTTADKLNDFLVNKMEKLYLDTETETTDEHHTNYSVSSGPFTTYNISSSNCFMAVAVWSNWLGYSTLSNIVANASSYKDYLAWRMLQTYGQYWTRVGTVLATPTPVPSATPEPTPTQAGSDPGQSPTPTPTPAPTPDHTDVIEAVIALAESRLGSSYVYGGGYRTANPSGFDCSGFTYWCYYYGTGKQVVLGNSAYKQGNDARFESNRVTGWRNCVRGDILCFKSDDSDTINHVGLYLGGGKFIHASSSSKGVIYSYFNSGNSANYCQRNLVWGYHVF